MDRAREAGGSAVARCAGSVALFICSPGACAPGFILPSASRTQAVSRKPALHHRLVNLRASANADVAITLSNYHCVNYCVERREKARKDGISDIVGDDPCGGCAGMAYLLVPHYYL